MDGNSAVFNIYGVLLNGFEDVIPTNQRLATLNVM